MEVNRLVHGSCLGFQQLHHSNNARIHPQYSDLIILIQAGHEKRGRKKEKLPALTGYSTSRMTTLVKVALLCRTPRGLKNNPHKFRSLNDLVSTCKVYTKNNPHKDGSHANSRYRFT